MKTLHAHRNYSWGILLIGLLILTATSLYGGNKNSTSNFGLKESYHEFVDEISTPVEGTEAIKSQLVYPRAAFLAGFEGKVIAKVYVNEKGNVDEVEFMKKMGGGIEESIKKVLLKTPFKPAIFNGVPVKSVAVLTFRYELD